MADDQLVFENLLATSSPTQPQRYEIRRVAPGAIVIQQQEADDKTTYYLATAGDRYLQRCAAELLGSALDRAVGG